MNKQVKMWLMAGCLASFMAYADDVVPAENAVAKEPVSVEKMQKLNNDLLQKLSPGMVRVNYFLKPDKNGKYTSTQYFCPGCQRMHSKSTESLVRSLIPMTAIGMVSADNKVLTQDLLLSADNIARIEIEPFDRSAAPVAVTVSGYYPERRAIQLSAAEAIPFAAPLKFAAPKNDAPLYGFFITDDAEESYGITVAGVNPFQPGMVIRDLTDNLEYMKLPGNTLIVTEDGTPAAASFNNTLNLKLDYLAAPETWNAVSQEEMQKSKANIQDILQASVLPVKLKLAELPKVNSNRYERDDDMPLEFTVPGIVQDNGNVMIPVRLDATATARLENITITFKDEDIPASFVGTSKELGTFTVKPDKVLDTQPIKIADLTFGDLADMRLWTVEMVPQDKKLNFIIFPDRCAGTSLGYKNQRTLRMAKAEDSFIFTPNGELLAVNIAFREQGKTGRYSQDREPVLLLAAVKDKFDEYNPDLVPKSESERVVIGYLGATYQEMNSELAEAHDVVSATNNGDLGLLVADVSADSPAAAAGLQVGDIMLRLVPETGSPVDLDGRYSEYDMSDFPWNRYDEFPEQYFDEMPTPWPNMNNPLHQALTQFGIGQKYQLIFLRNGERQTIDLTVGNAPENFYSTTRLAVPELGVTVCNITPEVRKYFRMDNQAEGVLIAREKAGSKASIAGLKPYEIIAKVGDVPVHNIDEFKQAVTGATELKLEIKRLAVSRIVNIKLNDPVSFDATAPKADESTEEIIAIETK